MDIIVHHSRQCGCHSLAKPPFVGELSTALSFVYYKLDALTAAQRQTVQRQSLQNCCGPNTLVNLHQNKM